MPPIESFEATLQEPSTPQADGRLAATELVGNGSILGFEATMIIRQLVLKVIGHDGPARLRILDEVVAPVGLEMIWPGPWRDRAA